MAKIKRHTVNNEIKEAKKEYFMNKFRENEHNSKQTWTTINELTSKKHHDSHIKE